MTQLRRRSLLSLQQTPVVVSLACAVCLFLLILPPAPVRAQTTYSEEMLEAFVSAAIEVRALAEKWTPAIESAGSEAEAQAFKDQATSEMAEIISRTEGITVAEYMEINKAAAGDSALMARIEQIYEARKNE